MALDIRLAILGVLACAASVTKGQVFSGLGFFAGDSTSQATRVSDDGLTVVGYSSGATTHANWRWIAGNGLQNLGLANPAAPSNLSYDGSVIVGYRSGPDAFSSYRWTTSGPEYIASLFLWVHPGPVVSGDGQVMGGCDRLEFGHPVLWTSALGIQQLPPPNPGPFVPESFGTVTGLSSDGQVAAGAAFVIISTPSGPREVPTTFRWTPSGGTQVLLNTDGTVFRAGALGMSQDGRVVISGLGGVMNVWTAATAWNQVPEMTVQLGISIPDISGDGNTIVSIDKVWNANTGTLPITTVLSNAGCDFSGWSNLIVTGVDFDGNTFCGYGTDPQGRTEAWYATVPAPASALVFAAALLGARRRR